ncbi:MAG: phenazine biosynthesis protein PhzF [Candidatus Aminicenantes bacterium RBG_13_59_9]|nr:MAG: phenazine biosynthesis protein PhzF [Candidatus Aminicenantes bacterium RBG_13_59_9]
MRVYILNAFAKTKRGGNPAGVVLDADRLSETTMQKIAARVGFSETAFVQRAAAADFKTRFFTPAAEVDLCGHATIAVFSLLFGLRRIRPGKHSQETRAGVLGVEVQEDGTVFMDQTLPLFGNAVDREDVAASLGIGLHSLAPDMPVQIVSTGLRDIIVPVISLPVLSSINPDLDKITEISQKEEAVGYHVFSLETKRQSTAHCRNLAPLYGIPEEAATGTSSGALACYLFKYGKITEDQAQRLVFEQGYAMKRPSEIIVRLEIKNSDITGVHVGGKATAAKEEVLSSPDAD